MHLVERVSATLLWGMVALTVAVALLINNGQLRLTTMAGALLVVVLLLVGLGLAGFFLALVHRRWLGHWWAWLLIVGLCILGGASVSGTPLSKDANVALLMSLSLPLGTGSLLGALAVTFARYDIGGMAIAAITLIDVWGLYFIARA